MLPIATLIVNNFTALAVLAGGSFLGRVAHRCMIATHTGNLDRHHILCNRIFHGTVLLIISNVPRTFVDIFFTNSLLVRIVFSLSNLNHVDCRTTMSQSCPIIFNSLFVFALFKLLVGLINSLYCALISPHVSFTTEGT